MSNIIQLHRSTELPDEWCAEHLQIGRWPGDGPARHVVIGDDLSGEEWRPVPGFERFYQVSDFGNVRSFHFGIPRPKKARKNGDGYPVLVLYGAGKRKTITLHRLVALVFHGDKKNALHNEVAHLNGNRADACAANLKWVSKVENHFHMRAHGTHQSGEQHGASKLTLDQVADIRSSKERSGLLAARFGCSVQNITDIRARRIWKTTEPCIAIAALCAIYFALQLARAL